MAALTLRTRPAGAADDPVPPGPPAGRPGGPVADPPGGTTRPHGTVRSWPLLVLAAPAAAEVWSGWIGIAQKTGFGLVSPLPGIWPSLHLDTTITLPVGVEAYAAYALRAWLASDRAVSPRTRRFAKRSAIFSFALGMAGQVTYHLLAQAGAARAPWTITTIVSCLPVLVLAMGTALAHMLRADAAAIDPPDLRPGGPAMPLPSTDRTRPDQVQAAGVTQARPGSSPHASTSTHQDHHMAVRTGTSSAAQAAQTEMNQARLIAKTLAAAGQPVTRRALRNGGVKGSNETLNALARKIKNELN